MPICLCLDARSRQQRGKNDAPCRVHNQTSTGTTCTTGVIRRKRDGAGEDERAAAIRWTRKEQEGVQIIILNIKYL